MASQQRRLSESASLHKIAARQFDLLQRHLGYIQQASPYYRELLAGAGFEPRGFYSLDQLAQLPLTDKCDLAARNLDFLAVAETQVVDICQTSGTTGEPVTIWQTEKDLQRLTRNEELAFFAAGISREDRVLICAALDRCFMAGLAYFLGLRKIGATAIRAGSGQPALTAELIMNQRPNVLVGVPSMLLAISRRLQRSGIDPATLGVDKLICIGEPIRSADLTLSPLGKMLSESWSAQVLGTYASTEMATAFADCTAGCGGHLLPELMLVEILDEHGAPVASGNSGEVVVTPLGIEGTPLLRYRTGDIARLHLEPCACGRKTPRLGPILGRRAQMLKYRGTTLFPAAISNALQTVEAVEGFYIEVEREFDLSDRIRVVVGCTDASLTAERLAELIAAKTRVKPEVVLVAPEDIIRKTILPERRKPVTFFDYREKE
jgi:phenylacetate-CoA ligase